MKYHCTECGKTVVRDKKMLERGRKAGIKEFCDSTGKYVRLMPVKKGQHGQKRSA